MTEGERIEKETEEALRHLGEPVTPELREYAEATSRGFLWKSALIGRNRRTYTCSLCGAEWEYDKRDEADIYQSEPFSGDLPHWHSTHCPSCMRRLDVYEVWRGKGKTGYKEHFIEQWRKSAIDGNVLVAVGAVVRRVYGNPGDVDMYPDVRVVSFVVYKYGRAGKRYVRQSDGKFYQMTKLNHLDANADVSLRELDQESFRAAIRGTPFERVWTDSLFRIASDGEYLNSPVMKMSWLSQTPTVEYMLKLGFEKLVCDRFSMIYTTGVINWRGKTMEEVFRMDRATVKALRPYGKRMGYEALNVFRAMRENGVTWPAGRCMDAILQMKMGRYSMDRFAERVRACGYRLQMELKYLMKQAESNSYCKVHDLEDYWRQCDRMNVAPDDYRTRHPKNLLEQHDEFSRRIQYVSESKYDDQIRDRLKEYTRKLGFSACGLILRPAKDTKEIIDEGSKLHHCVGGYCASYAQGRTVILVLRREDEPDKPFHTVEMKPDGTLIQCRGDHNRTAAEDQGIIDAFWSAYRACKGENRKTA